MKLEIITILAFITLFLSYILTSAEATAPVSDGSGWKWRNWYYSVAENIHEIVQTGEGGELFPITVKK